MDVNSSPKNLLAITGNVGVVRALKSPHVAYLKPVLGKILPKALSEICEKRPPDPIEYLARYLYQWADCELYYYEKAIFAKELQLMALQLEKETARRLARTEALKRETLALKYLTANKKALVRYLSDRSSSKASLGFMSKNSSFDSAVRAWARDVAADEYSVGRYAADQLSDRSSIRSHGHPSSTFVGKKRLTINEAEDRARRKKFSLLSMDDYDPSRSLSRTSSRGRRGKKYTLDEEIEFDVSATGRRRRKRSLEDGSEAASPFSRSKSSSRRRKYSDRDSEFGTPTGRRRGRKYGPDDDRDTDTPSGRRRGRGYSRDRELDSDSSRTKWAGRQSRQGGRTSRKGKAAGGTEEDRFADLYGAEAKLKYGFEVTPVRCSWYLAEPNILVCVHPVLGEIRATIPTRTPLSNTPQWWEEKEYKIEVMYDHEIYTHPSPHFDDDMYKDIIEVWEDEEVEVEDYLEEDEEDDVEEASIQ